MAEDRTLQNVVRFVIKAFYDSAGEVYVGIDNGRDCACCGITNDIPRKRLFMVDNELRIDA